MSAPAQPVLLASLDVSDALMIPVIHADREIVIYNAPASLCGGSHQHGETNCEASFSSGGSGGGGETCPICFDDVSHHPALQIASCQHVFHEHCLTQSLIQHDARCPVCRTSVGVCRGRCPSGTMRITALSSRQHTCPGYGPKSCAAIEITYTIPSGTQGAYHENPGAVYHGTTRTAYLPNNVQGRMVLSRLKYAWVHGLTFTVTTSLTTRIPNSVTWTSIHHKTSLHGGPHGFPDPNYIDNVNCALDLLNVPSIAAAGASSSAAYSAPVRGSEVLEYKAPQALNPNIPPGALHPYLPPTLHHNEPQGRSPSGSMTIEVRHDLVVPGFGRTKAIEIIYFVPCSTQRPYHPNPGAPYPETTRAAYLPNNADGRRLLVRLKYAWRHGLVFAIGTSLTTGLSNSVVWSNGIPHKTSLRADPGCPYSYPDDNYVSTCHAKLDALRVPASDLCL
jgi:deltex